MSQHKAQKMVSTMVLLMGVFLAIAGADEEVDVIRVMDKEILAILCPEGLRAEARVQCHQVLNESTSSNTSTTAPPTTREGRISIMIVLTNLTLIDLICANTNTTSATIQCFGAGIMTNTTDTRRGLIVGLSLLGGGALIVVLIIVGACCWCHLKLRSRRYKMAYMETPSQYRISYREPLLLTDMSSVYETAESYSLSDPAKSSSSQVPFINGIKVHECTEEGACFQVDDIQVTIPPGAIQGTTIHVEIGVALYGPFTFPENCKPVSPILWFCIQEDGEFNLPVTFKLPHVAMDDVGSRLAFAKADHSDELYQFTFKKVGSESSTSEYIWSSNHCYGVLTTKHCCFLCLQEDAEGKPLRELSVQRGYCLHILTKKTNLFTYKIIVLCTYFLETCFSALKLAYPEEKYESEKKQLVQFEIQSTPCLEVIPSTEEHALKLTEEDNNSTVRIGIIFPVAICLMIASGKAEPIVSRNISCQQSLQFGNCSKVNRVYGDDDKKDPLIYAKHNNIPSKVRPVFKLLLDLCAFTDKVFASKILASDVDFWTHCNDLATMKLKHDAKLYPPHITVQAHCPKHQQSTIILKIKGARETYTFRIPKQFGSLSSSSGPDVPVSDEPLQLNQHFNILYTTLYKSVAPRWEDFGIFLGIEPTTIERIEREKKLDGMSACLRELIKEWLRQINPPATKSSVLRALKELGITEEAEQLEKVL